jgi:hypothetical protein
MMYRPRSVQSCASGSGLDISHTAVSPRLSPSGTSRLVSPWVMMDSKPERDLVLLSVGPLMEMAAGMTAGELEPRQLEG